jgi:uroporphyrinogen III methyltransferase / synthase
MTRPTVLVPGGPDAHPLRGRRIVLTRPLAQSGDFEERVHALGGEPVVAAAIEIVGPESWTIADAALRRVGTYDWLAFTSANAVRMLVDRADAIGVARDQLRSRQLAVVGPATAAVVRTALRPPDFAPRVNTAEVLGEEITDVDNTRVLLPRGSLADDALPATLRARGAFVDEIVVYRTVPGPGIPGIVADVRESGVDALLFASASAVRFVADALVADTASTGLRRQRWPLAACLGPVTASAARACGFQSVIVADDATQNELIDAVARWFGAETGNGA